MSDGLPSHLGQIGSESILDSSISSADIAAGAVGNSDLASNAASGTKVSSEFAPVRTGSPAAVGNSIVTVASVTGAGSSAWITYNGVSFAGAPTVVAGIGAGGTGWVSVSGTQAGSCLILTENASTKVNLICAGSGRL